MSEIQITARLTVKPGQQEALKQLAARLVANVKEKEPGARQYDWFVNGAGTEYVVRETYDDAEAVLAHVANLGEFLPRLMAAADVALEVYGTPTNEVREALKPILAAEYAFVRGL